MNLARGARLVILDEPTSVLSRPEAERLWARLRELAAAGRSVVLITHKLADVAAAADRVVVMRGGRVVSETRDVTDREALVQAMVEDLASRIEAAARVRGRRYGLASSFAACELAVA